MRRAFFLSTIKQNATTLDIGSETISVSKFQIRMQAGVVAADTVNHYTPRLYYQNGKTYLAFINPTAEKPYGQARVVEFDSDYGFGRPFTAGLIPDTPENHSISVVQANDVGVYVFQEVLHNTPINVYKSANAFDPSQFTLPEQFGTDLAYVNILDRIGGNHLAWMRGVTAHCSIYQVLSSDGLEDWGTEVRITDTPSGGGPPTFRHYPYLPIGRWYANGKYYRLICKRKDQGTDGYFFKYHCLVSTPANLKQFTNLEGTYTHDVDVDGLLTDAILEANFMWHSMDGGGDIHGYPPRVSISPNGNFYSIIRDADGSANFSLKYFRNGSWIVKDLIIANLGLLTVPFPYIFAISDYDIRIVARINTGTFYRPFLFQTIDRGDNWTDLGDMCPEFTTGDVNVLIPNNIFDIPENKNFPLVFTNRDSVDTEWTNVMYKVAAFGSLQPMTTEPVTGAAIANYNSQGLFHYKCDDANITRSGNNVTALVDIFGLNNATGVNNPQWSTTNYVSFLQASQNRFTLASGITTEDSLTYIVVARFVPAVGYILLNFSQNTVTDKYIEVIVSGATGKVTYRIINTFTADTAGDDTVNDSEIHVIAVTIPGRDGVPPNIWIDGRLQYYIYPTLTDGATLTIWRNLGHGPANVAATSGRIGMRDLSSGDFFSSGDLFECALFSGVLPKSVLKSYVKQLCDDYSVTYRGEYEIPA